MFASAHIWRPGMIVLCVILSYTVVGDYGTMKIKVFSYLIPLLKTVRSGNLSYVNGSSEIWWSVQGEKIHVASVEKVLVHASQLQKDLS